jgi:hypothetical protein
MDNVERANQVMETWLPAVREHGTTTNTFGFFLFLMAETYREVDEKPDDDDDVYINRALKIWRDNDWNFLHLMPLRDLIAIDLDDFEGR